MTWFASMRTSAVVGYGATLNSAAFPIRSTIPSPRRASLQYRDCSKWGRSEWRPLEPRWRTACEDLTRCRGLLQTSIGVGLFLAPGALLCIYAMIIGKGDFRHGLSVALTQISRGYFQPELGGPNVPVCDGKFSDLMSDRPLFCFLYDWFIKLGGVWKLEFGPKAFLVISDPVCARYILKENMFNYNKGLLAEILEPIMGKGLIPADLETWKVRRRVLTPAFHDRYLRTMTDMFGRCCLQMSQKFDALLSKSKNDSAVVNMEDEFLNLALDIIGIGVFNFDFKSTVQESPVIKVKMHCTLLRLTMMESLPVAQAVYAVLKEAEHRSTFYFPYWNIPGANTLVPRLRRFHSQIELLNDNLNHLITTAKETAEEHDLEALQNQDYSKALHTCTPRRSNILEHGLALGVRSITAEVSSRDAW